MDSLMTSVVSFSRKVHVTKQTLELLVENAREYIIEPNFESQNDPFIMQNKLETFLLSRPARVNVYVIDDFDEMTGERDSKDKFYYGFSI